MKAELNLNALEFPINSAAQQAAFKKIVDVAVLRARRRLRVAIPRFVARPGDCLRRSQLRSARAAELAAWEASGGDFLASRRAN